MMMDKKNSKKLVPSYKFAIHTYKCIGYLIFIESASQKWVKKYSYSYAYSNIYYYILCSFVCCWSFFVCYL